MKREHKQSFGIVWDFDDVIFDTAGLKKAISIRLAKEGYSRKDVMRTVAIAKDANGYNPDLHGRMLANSPREARSLANMIREESAKRAKELVWKDARQTLDAFYKEGVPMYLLSSGKPAFQSSKISASGVRKYFKEIVVVNITEQDSAARTKIKILERFLKKTEPLLFVDDRPKNVEAVARAKTLRGRVIPIFVRRREEKVSPDILTVKKISLAVLRRALLV